MSLALFITKSLYFRGVSTSINKKLSLPIIYIQGKLQGDVE